MAGGQAFADASAALGGINRQGLGRTRHIDTGLFWVQEAAAAKGSEFQKVLGAVNPADLMAKYLACEVMRGHCGRLNLRFKGCGAEAAPHLKPLLSAVLDYDRESDLVAGCNVPDSDNMLASVVRDRLDHLWRKHWESEVSRSIRSPPLRIDDPSHTGYLGIAKGTRAGTLAAPAALKRI